MSVERASRREGATSSAASAVVSEPLLRLDSVTVRFGGLVAVRDFSLALHLGELVGLIGPNGAGKTTVFNTITGQYPPSEGRIEFAGREITGWRPDRVTACGIARTFQNIRLFPSLSVLDNVLVAHHVRLRSNPLAAVVRMPGYRSQEGAMLQEARALLDQLGLKAVQGEPAGSLPYGQQRRVEIARALATHPRLLLLDEPAAGMNPEETRHLMDFIRHIRKAFDLTILLIEHDMSLVMGICERIRVMDHGVSIAEGTPAQIQSDPRVIAAYLGRPDVLEGIQEVGTESGAQV